MARPQAFERELRIATQGLQPEAISKLLAQTARRALADAISSGEAPRSYVRAVNGRIGVSEDQVIPPGPIVYNFNFLPDVIVYGQAFFRERAPVKSGAYRDSLIVLVNGAQVRAFNNIPLDAEVILVPTVPYSRKIEVGSMVMRVPAGVIEDTRQAVMRRFGDVIVAQKRFISLAGAYTLRRGNRRKDRTTGKQLLYPALVVAMRF